MRKLIVLFTICLGVGLLVAGCASLDITPYPTRPVPTFAPEPTLNPAGDAAHGHALFVNWRCAGCHGPDALGNIGPRLARTTLSLDQFTLAVRQTRPPKPAFSESVLSSSDVRDLYTWVSAVDVPSGAGAQNPPATTGTLLGMTVYTGARCDSCHGAFGQGSKDAPSLLTINGSADAFLQKMLTTVGKYKEHSAASTNPDLMKRLYQWLREGANPEGGC